MQKYLKTSRLAISIAMLLAVGFLFVDFRDSMSSSWYRGLTWLQFTPSLIKFIQTIGHGLAITAYGFIVVLILTALFGRVYCSYICPLGIFQDVTNWCSIKLRKLRKKKFRLRFAKPQTKLRYSILAITCLSLFTGSIFLVTLLDPYSNFGRFVSNFLRPIYKTCNNILVSIFESFGSYALYPVTVVNADPFALIVPVLVFGLVIWLSVWRGRLFCNTVCPVGTLLGLVSNVSLYKIRFDASECNQCGDCMFVCKSQCINIKNREVDFSRCVGCGNCIKTCDKNAIRYALKPATVQSSSSPQNSETDSSKRSFIINSALLVTAISGLTSAKLYAQNYRIRRRLRNRKNDELHELGSGKGQVEFFASHAVTPPGSVSVNHFTKACTACHLCVSACPKNVLQPSVIEYGFLGMMQPFMDYDTSFCNYECTRCTEICPNGAILPLTVAEKLTTQTGVVRFEKRNCVVYVDENSCGACSEHCPTKAVRMVPYKGLLTIPEITPEICVGCGACEYICPVTPYKAIVVDGHTEHKAAQPPPEEDDLENAPLDDFPF